MNWDRIQGNSKQFSGMVKWSTSPTTIVADGLIESGLLRLNITLGGCGGRQMTLRLTPEVAAKVARLAGEFAHAAQRGVPSLTKLPNEFAIGSGVHDPVVFVRFEKDTPYGLTPDTALRLGQALIEEAEHMALRPVPAYH